MQIKYLILSALLCAFVAAAANGDTVILKSGARIKGEGTDAGEMIRV